MQTRKRIGLLAALILPLFLAACGESVWAPEVEVQQRIFRPEGPSKLSLITVQSTRSGSGAHTALMVTGSQRVLFDPAGSFKHPRAPERNDLLYGITDDVYKVYIDFHARETFDVVVQEVEVSPEVAEMALNLVQTHGAVGNAQCALSVSGILASLPGFETVPVGWFPNRASRAFGELPGATFKRITDDDADQNHGVLIRAAEDAI